MNTCISDNHKVSAKRVSDLIAEGMTAGQYTGLMRAIKKMDTHERGDFWELLKNEITPDQYWQISNDYRRFSKWGRV